MPWRRARNRAPPRLSARSCYPLAPGTGLCTAAAPAGPLAGSTAHGAPNSSASELDSPCMLLALLQVDVLKLPGSSYTCFSTRLGGQEHACAIVFRGNRCFRKAGLGTGRGNRLTIPDARTGSPLGGASAQLKGNHPGCGRAHGAWGACPHSHMLCVLGWFWYGGGGGNSPPGRLGRPLLSGACQVDTPQTWQAVANASRQRCQAATPMHGAPALTLTHRILAYLCG
jgi:hypothetical protein